MNFELIYRLVQAAWLALVVVWLLGALKTKRAVRSQSIGPIVIHRLALLSGYVLVFAPLLNVGFLGERFAPRSVSVAEIGMALTWAGVGFAIWARLFLGTNWSAAVSVKEDHRLIRSGPYAIVRHPIYSGLLLAIFGTTLVVGKCRALVGFIILSTAWHVKSRTEERFMREEFGEEYLAYRSQVKGLIPFVL